MNIKPLNRLRTLLISTTILPIVNLSIVLAQSVGAQQQPPATPTPAIQPVQPPPPSAPVSAPPPVPEYVPPPAPTPEYVPPSAPAPEYVPSPAPSQSIVRDKLGCDNKGQISTVRQIRLGEKVYCVLGIDSKLVDGKPTHRYTFQGTANQPLVIKLVGGTSVGKDFHPSFKLMGSGSQVVIEEKNSSKQRIIEASITVPATDTYTISIGNVDVKELGSYSFLVVEKDPNAKPSTN